ncbi:MAG: ABC transporter permease DevC [Pseudomonadota bacterium]
MTALLQRLLGRLPLGWMQLTHNPGRLAAALAGVAFAQVLVFVQLGIMGSMNSSIIKSYDLFNADIMISAQDANTLTEGGNVARQWMFQALADPGVARGTGLFLSNARWEREGDQTTFQVYALQPEHLDFLSGDISRNARAIALPNVAIIDQQTRGLDPDLMAGIRPQSPLVTEVNGQQLAFANTFQGGVSFSADGYMVTSEQTFLRLFPARTSGAPNHILLKVAAGHQADAVVARLRAELPETLQIRTVADAASEDLRFQTTERPTGLIFGFGVVMGIIVGIVIVYQVLSSDVADHLREYATLKAVGYGPEYFLGVVFEEAVILAVLGFIPGLLISLGLYALLVALTGLPVAMTPALAIAVLLGSLAACTVSGAIATRKLNAAEPADLF